jgi:hypothetical protein
MKVKITIILALLFLPMGKIMYGEFDLNNAQALFIYNFLSNVEWPQESVGSKYTVGVLGNTATTACILKYTEGRSIGQKPIEVVEYKHAADLNYCQLLFVAQGKSSEISTVVQKIKGKGCLIVSEKPGMINSGSVIDFSVIDGKLRYKISEQNAKDQHLSISSKLWQMSLK